MLPESVVLAPVEFATHEAGRVWAKFSQELTPSQLAELKTLEVSTRKSTRGADSKPQTVENWLQLFPLEKIQNSHSIDETWSERTPVLFELPESAPLAEIVTEMLRLGNDRLSYYQLQTSEGVKTLLLVKGPPFYTLLRALDRLDGPDSLKAYIEDKPRVWVEVGYQYPFVKSIHPAEREVLLISPPRKWQTLPLGKFHDIYEALTITLPSDPHHEQAIELQERVQVPMRLVRGGNDESAEFWVLNDDGISQLEGLVQNANEQLISRLAFAVGSSADDPNLKTVVVKVRPGRDAVPVLVLDGVECRSYLRIPHLFLPVGHRLHPPLRRDAVQKLLASDPNLNTWVIPQTEGSFLTQSLPDNAFRPLSEWVDYILDTERSPLNAWMDSMQFEFDSFVCPDESHDWQSKEKVPHHNTPLSTATPLKQTLKTKSSTRKEKQKPTTSKPQSSREAQTPLLVSESELEKTLQTLEQQFHEMQEPIHSPKRRDLWRKLAATNYQLKSNNQGAACYINGLWEQDVLDVQWIHEWFEAATSGQAILPLSGKEFERALEAERPMPSEMLLLAVHVISAGLGSPFSFNVNSKKTLAGVRRQLDAFDGYLPIQIAWLAWVACAQLSQDDVLTLARKRDRFLERLYHYGLNPEHDLPGFLHAAQSRTGKRFGAIQNYLVELTETIRSWVREEFTDANQTYAYADLILAYGLSRGGLESQCQELVQEAQARLLDKPNRNFVHQWVLDAFLERISQSRQGLERTSRLGDELMQRLEHKSLDPAVVFVINSLRAKSRILQPYEQIDPQRRYVPKFSDDLSLQIDALTDIAEPAELADRIFQLREIHEWSQLVDQPDSDAHRINRSDIAVTAKSHQVLLAAVLPFAPRLGASQTQRLLNEVVGTLEVLTDSNQQTVLLERALVIAAHYGQTAYARLFVHHLQELIESHGRPETAAIFGLLLGQSIWGFRKLGMRGELSQLLDQIERLIREGRFALDPTNTSPRGGKKKFRSRVGTNPAVRHQMDVMSLQLNVAAGWFNFGDEPRAVTILDEVEQFLLTNSNISSTLRRAAICRYAQILEQAPMEYALPKFQEIFTQLHKAQIDKGQGSSLQDQYYSYEPLVIIEAVILALMSDDFTLDPKLRNLLDEQEFSIRQRIHRDMEHAQQPLNVVNP